MKTVTAYCHYQMATSGVSTVRYLWHGRLRFTIPAAVTGRKTAAAR
jgi:hypothetical protein